MELIANTRHAVKEVESIIEQPLSIHSVYGFNFRAALRCE